MLKGKALLAMGLVGFLMLGLQAPAHAKTAESDTRLAVANTVRSDLHQLEVATQLVTVALTTVTVQPGDTLFGLAARHCGNNTWQGIYNDNVSVVGANPSLIYPGQQLVINCIAETVQETALVTSVPPAAASGWVNPLPGRCISSGFRTAERPYHNGVDLGAGNSNLPVHTAAAGTVSAQWDGGGGNMAMVNHGNGLWTVYMHFASYEVTSGWVSAGQVIGYAGQTGNAYGNHLHFEVHPWGLWRGQINPVPFMNDRGVRLGC